MSLQEFNPCKTHKTVSSEQNRPAWLFDVPLIKFPPPTRLLVGPTHPPAGESRPSSVTGTRPGLGHARLLFSWTGRFGAEPPRPWQDGASLSTCPDVLQDDPLPLAARVAGSKEAPGRPGADRGPAPPRGPRALWGQVRPWDAACRAVSFPQPPAGGELRAPQDFVVEAEAAVGGGLASAWGLGAGVGTRPPAVTHEQRCPHRPRLSCPRAPRALLPP